MDLSPPLLHPQVGQQVGPGHPHDDPPYPFLSTVSETSCLTLPASVTVIKRAAITNDAILFIIVLVFIIIGENLITLTYLN